MTGNFIEDSLKRIDEKLTKIESMIEKCTDETDYLICSNGKTIGINLNDAYYQLSLLITPINKPYDDLIFDLLERIEEIEKALNWAPF